jgi:hypothetical protein
MSQLTKNKNSPYPSIAILIEAAQNSTYLNPVKISLNPTQK